MYVDHLTGKAHFQFKNSFSCLNDEKLLRPKSYHVARDTGDKYLCAFIKVSIA